MTRADEVTIHQLRTGKTPLAHCLLTDFASPYSLPPLSLSLRRVWRHGERNLQVREQKSNIKHTCAERAQTQVTSSQRRTTKVSQTA